MNKLVCAGVLGSDPEPINKGCKLSIATKTKTGGTLWLDVFCFGTTSDLCLKYKKKGERIFIDGHLEQSNNGNLVIIADSVGFL